MARYEIRWRRADIVGAWTTISVAPGDQGQITGIQRGLSYQVEARAVGTNGAASVWVQQTHLVSNASQLPIAPTSLAALSVADGVHLNWSVLGTQRSDVEYAIERTSDAGGLPDGAHWANIANIKASAYTDGVTDGIVRWYRVRAVDFQGLTSAYTNNVNSNNKSVANGADVTAEQPISHAGANQSIIPNGDFVLGDVRGWVTASAAVAGTWHLNAGGERARDSDSGSS